MILHFDCQVENLENSDDVDHSLDVDCRLDGGGFGVANVQATVASVDCLSIEYDQVSYMMHYITRQAVTQRFLCS